MTNIAFAFERSIDLFGDYESIVHVPLSAPDTVHRSGELHALALSVGAVLPRLGVEPGDRVMVMLPNAPETGALYSGIARCGAVVLPVLFLLPDADVGHIMREAEPKVVITSAGCIDKVRRAAEGVNCIKHVICLDAAPSGVPMLEDIMEPVTEAPIVARDDGDLAFLVYTGGTTGRPKGAMLTHGNLGSAAERAARISEEENGLSAQDVSCLALPLAHAYGVLMWLLGAHLGGRTVLLPWFEAGTWFRCVEEYRCTTSPLVPVMMSHLLDHRDPMSRDTSSLRLVTTGAAALPVEVAEAFEDRFGCPVLEGWGLTESVALGTLNRLTRRRRGSIGLPVEGVDVSVRPASGDGELAPGELGEICMRGPHVMAGYWGLHEETQRALRDGWLRTGDVGYADEDGFYYIVDRVDDLINRGGFDVYPRDVEETLQAHPAVLEAAAVGVPDATMGEEVRAFVVLKPGATSSEEEMLEHCNAQLPAYKCPRSISFLDALPKTGVGKILRRELRETGSRARTSRAQRSGPDG